MQRAKQQKPDRSSARGFTLMELMVASTLSVVIVLGVGQFFVTSSSAFSDLASRSHLSARAQVVMERVATELAAGRFVTLDPPVPDNSSWIRFDKIIGFEDGAPVYSNPFQIELIERPGEETGAVRIWEDRPPLGTTPGTEDVASILTGNVPEGGLTFSRTGATLQIALTFEIPDAKSHEPHELTLVTGVMRNEE